MGYSTTQFTRIVIANAIVQKKVGLNEPEVLCVPLRFFLNTVRKLQTSIQLLKRLY